MSSKFIKPTPEDENCIDCGAPVEAPVGGIAICENCLSTRGSCCSEFAGLDLTEGATPREFASSPCSAHPFGEVDVVRHDPVARRFETFTGACLDYQITTDDAINIAHTFVPERLRGKGLAVQLMEAVIGYARKSNLKVQASCDYAKAYLDRDGT